MNLQELKTPIRIYWDLAPLGEGVAPDFLQIAGQVVGLKILSLDLREFAPVPSAACLAILARLHQEPIAVALTLPLAAVAPAVLEQLSSYRLKTVSLAVSSAAELATVRELRHALPAPGPGAPQLGVSFEVTRDNYRDLPLLLFFCATEGLPLVLPMQRLEPGADCFFLTREEQQELAGRLAAIVRPEKMRVTIHDPFLWRLFFPAVNFPNGRCQAANTMLSIAANGDVYPCPSLPVRLGSLKTETLAAIAASPEKKEVRDKILRTPEGCGSCSDLENCLGGCRGRGLCVTASWEEPDPGCGETPG